MDKIVALLFFYLDSFGIKWPATFDKPLKKKPIELGELNYCD